MQEQEFRARFISGLNRQQAAAVEAVDGPTLLLAVPGSGKTTVLVTRLGYMVLCRGIAPERILTMTYTVAATADMRGRFASLFGRELAERMEFRTINGVCARIIRLYESLLGRQAFPLISDEGELNGLVSSIYRETNREFATESTIKTLRTWITYIKNMELSDGEIGRLKPEGIDLAPIYRAYCAALRHSRRMDYDDQMVYACRVLRQYPEILARVRRQYPYICVDEAQDTSKIQHRIISLLAGRQANLFMVGDEDQSIYGFRAAYPEALLEFERVYPGGRVLYLERNYRSAGEIVKAADEFIQKNRSRRQKHMEAARPQGEKPTVMVLRDRKEQYTKLVELAGSCARETAVLFRNNDSALPLIDALTRAKVPYRCRRFDSGFFNHKVVRDITDIIHFAADPNNGELFLRIYYKFHAGISKAAADQSLRQGRPPLAYLSANTSLSDWTRERCYALQTHLACLLRDTGGRAIGRIVDDMGYGEYLQRVEADKGKIPILESLGSREENAMGLLRRLEELARIAGAGSAPADCRFILSTVHSSKGLEYENVILADVADGIFPMMTPPVRGLSSKEDWDAYEEERRLFYVAMTRAKDRLTLIRFQDAELKSTFAEELCPTEKSKPSPQKPKKQVASGLVSRISAPSQDTTPYRKGVSVRHTAFGPGTILERNGDIIAVEFQNGAQRGFSLSACLRQGILSLQSFN